MRKIGICVVILCLLPMMAGAVWEDNAILASALSMLETGNPFLVRYNQMTGKHVEARFPLGCPYFWGGRDASRILETMRPWQASPAYYRTDRSYLYGLDCTGFTRWALENAGYATHPSNSDMLYLPENAVYAIPDTDNLKGEELSQKLLPGDLLFLCHGGRSYHVALFAGTLLDYGYRVDTVPPELIPYLAYPLLIHSTVSSDYYERYETYIEDTLDWRVYPPDGGVIVSILGVPRKAAIRHMLSPLDDEMDYFLLDGYKLMLYDDSRDEKRMWARWRVV